MKRLQTQKRTKIPGHAKHRFRLCHVMKIQVNKLDKTYNIKRTDAVPAQQHWHLLETCECYNMSRALNPVRFSEQLCVMKWRTYIFHFNKQLHKIFKHPIMWWKTSQNWHQFYTFSLKRKSVVPHILLNCVLFFPLISVQNSEFGQHVCFHCIHFHNKINEIRWPQTPCYKVNIFI